MLATSGGYSVTTVVSVPSLHAVNLGLGRESLLGTLNSDSGVLG